MITVMLIVINTRQCSAQVSCPALPSKGQAKGIEHFTWLRGWGDFGRDLQQALLKMHFLAMGSFPLLCPSDSTPNPATSRCCLFVFIAHNPPGAGLCVRHAGAQTQASCSLLFLAPSHCRHRVVCPFEPSWGLTAQLPSSAALQEQRA